jgi:hypothetical protein
MGNDLVAGRGHVVAATGRNLAEAGDERLLRLGLGLQDGRIDLLHGAHCAAGGVYVQHYRLHFLFSGQGLYALGDLLAAALPGTGGGALGDGAVKRYHRHSVLLFLAEAGQFGKVHIARLGFAGGVGFIDHGESRREGKNVKPRDYLQPQRRAGLGRGRGRLGGRGPRFGIYRTAVVLFFH